MQGFCLCPAAPQGLTDEVLSNKHIGSIPTARAAVAKNHIFLHIQKSKGISKYRKTFSGTQKYFENQGGKWHETTPFLREMLFKKTVSL